MKKKEWNEGLNHIDPDLVEKYVDGTRDNVVSNHLIETVK